MRHFKLLTALVVLMLCCIMTVAAFAETSFSFLGDISWDSSREEIETTMKAKPFKFTEFKNSVEQDNQLLLGGGKVLKYDIRWVSFMFNDSGELQSIALYSAKSKKGYSALVGAMDKEFGKHNTDTITRVSNRDMKDDDGMQEYDVPVALWKTDDVEAYLYGTAFGKLDTLSKGKDAFIIVINRPGVNMTEFSDHSNDWRAKDQGEVVENTWGTTYSGAEDSSNLDAMFATTGSSSFKTEEQIQAEEERAEYIEQWSANKVDTSKVWLVRRSCSIDLKSGNVPSLTLTAMNFDKEETIVSLTVKVEFLTKEADFVPVFGTLDNLTITRDVKIKPGKTGKITLLAYGAEGARQIVAYVAGYTTADGKVVEIPNDEVYTIGRWKR